MKLSILPKNKLGRLACYLILMSIILLFLFYVLDEYIINIPSGFLWILLNGVSILSFIVALLGTMIGIYSVYRHKEISVMVMLLLLMGFTFSLFGIFDLLLPKP